MLYKRERKWQGLELSIYVPDDLTDGSIVKGRMQLFISDFQFYLVDVSSKLLYDPPHHVQHVLLFKGMSFCYFILPGIPNCISTRHVFVYSHLVTGELAT
jgi:hypothetical protein